MGKNALEVGRGLKLQPVATADAPDLEDGVMYYDSDDAKFKLRENGSTVDITGGSGSVSAGVAGRLALYPASAASVDDVYVQNSQNIDVAIVAQGSRSAPIEYTIPNPGNAVTAADFVLTEGTQTVNGNKTFGGSVVVTGDLTVNGTTTSLNTTNTTITDKLVTLNKGGGAASGGGSGIEIEENSSITGYIKSSSARTGFDLKAPATAGVATIVTNASSFTYTLPDHSGTIMTDVVDDTTPQLGGELDVNGNAIASASNGNVAIAPHGTGRVRLANQGALSAYRDEKYIHGITLTASTTAVLAEITFDSKVYKSEIVEYQIREATTFKTRTGTLYISVDGDSGVAGSNVSVVNFSGETASVGVTWAGAMNSDNVEISYTTTSNNKVINMTVKRYLA